MKNAIGLTFLIFIPYFVAAASAKMSPSKLTSLHQPLYGDMVYNPNLMHFEKNIHFEQKIDAMKYVNDFGYKGNSFMSEHQIKDNNINTRQHGTPVRFSFFPMYDSSDDSSIDDYENARKNALPSVGLIRILKIEFPFF